MSERPVTEVSAGVFLREDGSFLVAQRPQGKPYAGYWEFPGGKVEAGESAAHALVRELEEELGIEPLEYYPWITRTHRYEHATVRLRFFRITRWRGDFVCREFQQITWQQSGAPGVAPMLPANGPVMRALELPSLLGISQATQLGAAAFGERLHQSLSAGLRFVMLRENTWTEEFLLAYGRDVLNRCRQSGALVVVNGAAELAQKLGADGVHLTSRRLMEAVQRPESKWCGASCHDAEELAQAAHLGLDYVVLGPVQPTLSHPGQPALGWARFGALVRDYPLPVYALGGLNASNVREAWSHGAHGIAMMRAAWHA
ncbi:MAG: Nudix family hydrolase [Burkholderiales bacterium]